MLRSIIAELNSLPSDDQVTKDAIERLQTAHELDGDSINPTGIVADIREAAEKHPLQESEQLDEAFRAYAASLHEPQRTMFLRHLDGQTYVQIAESMCLGKKAVLKSLAKMYSELRISLEPSN